jgi:hypothetical protein
LALFPDVKREFKPMLEGKPLIVCLCGSTSLWDVFPLVNEVETLKGNIVLSVGVNMKKPDENLFFLSENNQVTPDGTKKKPDQTKIEIEKAIIKEKLDWLHRRKIDLASVVIIIQTDGEKLGSSTEKEKEYAERIGKKVEVRWVCKCRKLIPDDLNKTKCDCGHGYIRAAVEKKQPGEESHV